MLAWVVALCGERSWGRQDLGAGTSPFQPVRGFPHPSFLAFQEGPKKIPGRESQAPTASSGGDNVPQATAAPAQALFCPRYFCHLAHTPQMGRSSLTFQSSKDRWRKGPALSSHEVSQLITVFQQDLGVSEPFCMCPGILMSCACQGLRVGRQSLLLLVHRML